jgi:hypothetical protein
VHSSRLVRRLHFVACYPEFLFVTWTKLVVSATWPSAVKCVYKMWRYGTSMSGKNRRWVADEPAEFKKQPVEVGGFRKISDRLIGNHLRGICSRIYLKWNGSENRKMSTCNWLDLESLGS